MRHRLGLTRSAFHHDHLVQTPDTFVRAALPGMKNATAIVHCAPQIGAKFLQYTAEFDAGGILPPAESQRFVYILEGELDIGGRGTLKAGDYAYLSPGSRDHICASAAAKATVIEKPYQELAPHDSPAFFTGREPDIAPQAFMNDPGVELRALLPATPSFDFAVNTMTFQPGATLPMVEIHVMEHGLVMLEGAGIYRLNDRWYPVSAGDFIWMAPFCPQWFGALGKQPAKYLLYKDWNRNPAAA